MLRFVTVAALLALAVAAAPEIAFNTITATVTAWGNNVATLAADDDIATYYDANGRGAIITGCFGSTESIARISYHPRMSGQVHADRMKNGTWKCDATAITTLTTVVANTYSDVSSNNFPMQCDCISFEFSSSGDYGSIAEIKVYKFEDPEWEAYKAKYQKHYASDLDEQQRYALFQESKTRVAGLNSLNGGGNVFGINWMSDRQEEEKYKKGLVKPKNFKATAPVLKFETSRSPASINWRDTEAVTSIKNQGQCGSCWAFSATEAIESQMILGTGGKFAISLAPQQIASCAPSTGNYSCMGCNGGFTEGAYEYVKSAPGLANSFFIPYAQSLTQTEATKACPTTKVNAINGEYEQLQGRYAQVEGYSYAMPPCTSGACENQDLKAFAAALERTPLSVCVNAGNWNDYQGGVMTSAACGPMGAEYQDHCVMATGFNTTAPTPYWIVRNSWASTFGEEGYIYLEMAKNTCGLADDATIPHVTLDLTVEEHAEATVRREAMFQRATQGSARPQPVII